MWLISSLAVALAAVRLYLLGLHGKYRFFFGFLVLQTARTLALAPFDVRRSTYAWIFFYTQPLLWLAYVLVVHELYSLVLASYRGISTFGRRAMYGLLGVSVLVSCASLVLSWRGPVEAFPILRTLMQLERGVDFSLVVFLLLILAFLVWYPVPLNRNVVIHSFIYFVYFLTHTTVLLIRSMGGWGINRAASTVAMGIAAGCAVAWLSLMSKGGEERVYRERISRAPGNEKHLLASLEALNSTLLRAGRKAEPAPSWGSGRGSG